MEKIFVKPAKEGAIVRHPEKLNHKLKPEGEWVMNSIQWQRYLKHGDVVVAQPPVEEPKVEKPSKPAKGAQ
jgi:Protein of unknown function (DUF2635).